MSVTLYLVPHLAAVLSSFYLFVKALQVVISRCCPVYMGCRIGRFRLHRRLTLYHEAFRSIHRSSTLAVSAISVYIDHSPWRPSVVESPGHKYRNR